MLHIQYRTIHIIAVGVRTVKDHKLLALLRTNIHQAQHGDVVGIETQTYILNIGDENIECRHGFFGGAFAFAVVEREDRYACLLIDAAGYQFTFAGGSTKSMLWREDSGHVHTVLEQKVKRMNRIAFNLLPLAFSL